MRHSRVVTTVLSLISLPGTTATALPYIPTTAFVNSTNATGIYIFEPNNDATSASLVFLDSSRSLTSNYAATTVSSPLPFLANSNNSAFSPFVDDAGNLYALAGDCGSGSNGASLWTLKAGQDAQNRQWVKADLTTADLDSSSVNGVNYLASGFAFASARNDTPTLYTFGGMCPNASASSLSSATWQGSANYSRALLMAAPSGVLSSSNFASISSNQDTFRLDQSSARGPPVAEAGFSVTALQPSYSGSNQSTVQQNLVFVGGHTSQAFINMSQVALLSLPEQSWSFLPISNPGSTSGELIKRSSNSVEPRSGHTALLSEDGTKVIVFGGWVGDVNTPALPQLAVLSVGSGYGGNGNWQWSVPTTQGAAPSGSGLYGHGAVMLPGNTMMIIGGSAITGKGSKTKRATSRAYYLNVTSNKWTSDYTNPTAPTASNSADADMAASHRGRSIGLGVGLGLGIPLFFIALCLIFCCLRRRHRRDKERQRILSRALAAPDYRHNLVSQDTGYDPGQTAMMERPRGQDQYHWAPIPTNRPNPEAPEGGWRNSRSVEAERTGLLVEIPSPTRGLRRGLHGRSNSHYDDTRPGQYSAIHVIDECDEHEPDDGDLGTAQAQDAEIEPKFASHSTPASRPASSYRLPEIRTSPPILDPFVDPLGAHPIISSGTVSPVSSSPGEEREREYGGWIADWEALNTRINTQDQDQSRGLRSAATPSSARLSPVSSNDRKGSPNHSDRTTSTLSEKSMHSAVSHVSSTSRQSAVSLRHNPSQRSTNLFSVRKGNQDPPGRKSMPVTGTVAAAVANFEGTPPSQPRPGGRGHARNQSNDSMTGSPGQKRLPSFGTLQAESQALLGGRSAATPSTHLGHTTNIEPTAGESYVDPEDDEEFPYRPNQRRSRGLMGSVRSALSRGRGRASSSSPTNQTVTTSPTTGTFRGSSPSRSGTGTPFSLLRSVASEHESASQHQNLATGESSQVGHRRTDGSGPGVWSKRHSGARDWDWRQGVSSGQLETAGARRPGSDEKNKRQSNSSPDTKTITESLRDDASEEWDVEGAIETRRVQVMFTVPREKLRVINGSDGDAESMLTRQEPAPEHGKGKERAHEEQEEDIGEQSAQIHDDSGYSLRNESTGKYKPGRGSPGLW